MQDHVHLIWKNLRSNRNVSNINSFKKYTGNKILKYLAANHPEINHLFLSDRKDRKNKFWKLNSMSIPINDLVTFQKIIDYIHKNPTKGDYKYSDLPYEYQHSSAMAYFQKESNFSFLTLLELK